MKILREKRGQSTLEYAVLVVVIIGALVAMQIYVKRGVQGKLRESTDQIGEQFSPGYTTYNKTANSFTHSNETTGAFTTQTQIIEQTQNRSTNEAVQNETYEYWGE